MVKEAGQRAGRCTECGEPDDLYYERHQGLPLTMPMCGECYERAVQMLTLEAIHDDKAVSDFWEWNVPRKRKKRTRKKRLS